MSFERVGISLCHDDLTDVGRLADDLEVLKELGPDFVEVCPQRLGVILGGQIDWGRMEAVRALLAAAGLGYTVHPPLRLNLMDLDRLELQRSILESGVRFAGEIGASVVVCHAGVRKNRHHARHSLGVQLAAERSVLREVGDVAGELGVIIAVENWCPITPITGGEDYTYSVWPSELAGQVAAVDHPSVGVCLDVGRAFVASNFYGFDFVKECAAAAPLVRHLHLHDNFGRPEPAEEREPSERLAYGHGDLHLPPGKGSIPLEQLFSEVVFTRNPTCCVELPPNTHHTVAKGALDAARTLAGLSPSRT